MLAAAVLLACSAPRLPAQAWHVAGAHARVRLRTESGTNAPADTGVALLHPHADGKGAEIRVFTVSGTPVGHELLWAAEGEPTEILFDTSSGEPVYLAYLAAKTTNAPPAWQRSAGLVLETRHYDPEAAGDWKDPRTLWSRPAKVLGRSLVTQIHHGVHPHGPTRAFASHYKGTLNVANAGDYDFATVSDDASYLLVNGHTVASWPGDHVVHPGRRAQHHGRVRLKAGRQKIEYYNVQDQTQFSVSAAWRPPGSQIFEIIPEQAFAGVTRFDGVGLEVRPGLPPDIGFQWKVHNHSLVDDMALVNVRFRVMADASTRKVQWVFDDGTRASGPEIEHLFPASGLRTVRVELLDGKERIAARTQTVRVHPRWTQRPDWPEPLLKKQRADLMQRDLSAMPVADLVALVKFAERIEDRPMLDRLGGACLDRSKEEFSAETADAFYRLGFHYQHPEVRRYAPAEKALRLAAELSEDGSQARATAKVHLAGFLIHCREQADAAQLVMKSIDEAKLGSMEARLKRIFEGDALLCQGHAGAARRAYAAVGLVGGADTTEQALRRRARLETAKDYVRRGEYDAAERMVREIEWEAPTERINTETGLVLIRAHLGRREFTFARAHCRRLLHAAPMDTHRPEILLRLTEACLALKQHGPAQETLRRLLDEHPYSEAAARAKDQWGTGLSKTK